MNQSSYSPYSNDAIVRKVHKLEKEFSCTLMPMQITDIFYANFIQWAHETGNCYSTIKLYCNQLKAAMSWASKHGCLLSQTFNVYEVPRYFKSRVALSRRKQATKPSSILINMR